MRRSKDYDVLVVGGGVIGCAAARALAADADVLLLEKEQLASGATGAASGVVNLGKSLAAVGGARRALEFFRDYDGTNNFTFTGRPGVQLIGRPADIHPRYRSTDFQAMVDERASAGFDVAYHSTDELEDRFPGRFDLSRYVGAVEYRDTGWVDPHSLTLALKRDAERRGATVRTGTVVQNLLLEDGAVRGVETAAATIHARAVVIAAGWRTRELVGDYVRLPVRPFRYQTANLDVRPQVDDDCPLGWDTCHNLYWRPEHNGELHVGGGTYFVDETTMHRRQVTERFRLRVAETIPRVLPGFDGAAVASTAVCPTGDAATPDTLPIIDAPAELGGTGVVATGFHGHGIMGAPMAAAVIRSFVTGDPSPYATSAVSLDRFADRSTAFGSSYIREPGAGSA